MVTESVSALLFNLAYLAYLEVEGSNPAVSVCVRDEFIHFRLCMPCLEQALPWSVYSPQY